ncbi:Fusaric acid resistance protein family protein [Desulfonatronum thiosulfatophilum]|uniref:Fusaric acid resistance protein family protein n=1 Tax=Desulfonatronum thiosulfatophilum TaxID=617002 RepID=A0A1G6ABC1_9BACT|nr:FUSC family protein [Desulfonatronum thiosulfatophilum]SDB05626.1 Fusaric acid resistance protein family protein [Desulfonatronum thiosulfatophilum]
MISRKTLFTRISPDHLRHGLKTGLAAVLAYAVVFVFDLEYGFWGVLSAVIVMQINVADSVQMCWYRLTGTVMGALIGIAAILAFPEPGWQTALGLFLSVGFCAYMTRYNPRYLMAAITVVIIVVAGSEEEQRVLFGLYRILEIGIGVSSAFLVTVLVWPRRAGTTLREQLRSHFAEAAHCHDTLVEAFLSRQTTVNRDLLDNISAKSLQSRELLNKAIRHERLLSSEDTATLSQKVTALENCVEQMRSMQNVLNNFEEGEGYDIIMAQEVRSLARVIREVMVSIGEGREAVLNDLADAVRRFDLRLEELRSAGVTKRFNLHKLLQVFSFLHALEHTAKGLLKMRKSPA